MSNTVSMDDERPRTVRMPQWLWDALDRDAIRCKRSSVKQLEVVLTAYYRKDDTQLNFERLERLRAPETMKTQTVPVLKEKAK